MKRSPIYVCGLVYVVDIYWAHTVKVVNPIQAMSGIERGQELDQHYQMTWHSPTFARDDIESIEVQNGYQRHNVSSVRRKYYRLDDDNVSIAFANGRARIACREQIDPFLAGFTRYLVDAIGWVVTGNDDLLDDFNVVDQ